MHGARSMTIITIPSAPTVGKYTSSATSTPHNNTATQQRENFVTVATNSFDGQYQGIFQGFEAIEDTGGTVFIKEGVYFWDLPTEKIVLKSFGYSFVGVGKGLVTIKIEYDGTINAIESAALLCTLTMVNINIIWDATGAFTNQRLIELTGANFIGDSFIDCNFSIIGNNITNFIINNTDRNLFIDRCTFNGAKIGVRSLVTSATQYSTTVTNSEIIDCLVCIDSTSNLITVENNKLEGYTSEGILLSTTFGGGKIYFNNNKLIRGGFLSDLEYDMFISAGLCTVKDNTILWDLNTGIQNRTINPINIKPPAVAVASDRYFRILNNTVEILYETTNTTETALTAVRGIRVDNIDAIGIIPALISGNTVKIDYVSAGPAAGIGYGIEGSSASRLQINDNTIDIQGSNVTIRTGINLGGDWNNASDNRILNATTPIVSAGANDITLSNITV